MVLHLLAGSHSAWSEMNSQSTSLLQIPGIDAASYIYIIHVLLCTSHHIAEFLLQTFSSCLIDEWEAKIKAKTLGLDKLNNHRLETRSQVLRLGQFL